jgi:ubiquinone/menaquinone biosynthesis C-methylase UbiE
VNVTSHFQEFFASHPGFMRKDDLFYQRDLLPNTEFEKLYVALRLKEGRIYPDDMVKGLPMAGGLHPLSGEWRKRRISTEKLVKHIRQKNKAAVLEIGCGNGWLTHHLNRELKVACCGVDINEQELVQAARVFNSATDLCFVHGDIMSPAFDAVRADVIVLASSIQYFGDVTALVERLLSLLYEGGEIHILDSPLYSDAGVATARERSKNYFENLGFPGMEKYYHQHSRTVLRKFNQVILHNPDKFITRVRIRLAGESPFPWIRITRK